MTAHLHSYGLMAFDLLPLEECFVLTLSTLGNEQKDSGIYKFKLKQYCITNGWKNQQT